MERQKMKVFRNEYIIEGVPEGNIARNNLVSASSTGDAFSPEFVLAVLSECTVSRSHHEGFQVAGNFQAGTF